MTKSSLIFYLSDGCHGPEERQTGPQSVTLRQMCPMDLSSLAGEEALPGVMEVP